MQLHLLGTVGYYPNRRGHTTCLMLPEAGVVLDAGTGMFRIRPLIQTEELDIYLTHTHLDHVVGLTYLLGLLHGRPLRRVRVHAAREKLASLERHLFAPDLFPVPPPYEPAPLGGPGPLPGGGRIRPFPLEHPGGAVGYRLDWPGRSMALVTDTTAAPDAPYVEAVRGVDVLVHECYFPDGWEEQAAVSGHSCATPVAETARAARVGRLVLIHLNPAADGEDPVGLDGVRRVFPRAELGRDGMVVQF